MRLTNTATFRSLRMMTSVTAISLIAASAYASEVVLTARDGSADVTGELVSFESGTYTVRTSVGEMMLSSSDVSCLGEGCPELAGAAVDLVLSGSDTIGDELMPLLLTGFASVNGAEISLEDGPEPEQRIASLIGDQGFGDALMSALIKAEGSSSAFRDLLSQDAMIGMASRRIRREEARNLKENGGGVMVSPGQEHIIAVDALRVLVSADNKVDALSIEQLAGIYSGTFSNWSELGGADLPITVLSRDESSGTRGVFDGRILDDQALRGDVTIVSGNGDMVSTIVDNPGAIGYVGFAYGQGAKSIDVVTECGIRTRANAFEAKTEAYPLQRRLYLYSRADNLSDQASEFLEFASSADADSLIGKAGFIDLGVERIAQDAAALRVEDALFDAADLYVVDALERLHDEMSQWDRLSTSFRFPAGSTSLSNKAKNDLARLVDYLGDQPDGTRVAIVGFTDNEGPFQSNVDLSKDRSLDVLAQVVGSAGQQLGNIEFSAMGFGPMAPEACNSTESGKSINRRVEVWIR